MTMTALCHVAIILSPHQLFPSCLFLEIPGETFSPEGYILVSPLESMCFNILFYEVIGCTLASISTIFIILSPFVTFRTP